MQQKHTALLRGAALSMALLLGICPSAIAQNDSGGNAGDWLSQYTTARTLGLGGAFVATADDALAALWNPAGISQLYQNEVDAEHGILFEDTSVNALSFAVPGSRLPTFGISMISLRSGNFERTNELNDNLGTFGEGETAFLFSAAKTINPQFSVGANLKVVRQSIEDFSSGGVGFDLGGLYQVTPALRIGASVLNLGGPSMSLRTVDEKYPVEFRGGFSVLVFNGRGLISAQMDGLSGTGARFHTGAEYWIQPKFALRVGYDDTNPAGGFTYRVSDPFEVDYGVRDQELGLTHRLGLTFRFGGYSATSKADPEIFSPTGTNSVTKIHLKAKTKADAESWTLQITDKLGVVVRQFGGKGLPPAHLLWDGKDETGLPLPDGTYRYELTVIDKEGRKIGSPTGTVEISTGGPQGSVPVIPVTREP